MSQIKLDIKPLTVNQCWQGKRFKTPKYNKYERDLLYILPRLDIPEGPLRLTIKWGVSSKLSDADNPVKPFQDCLQKRYGFNDSRVFELNITKEIVKKGDEFILFSINPLAINI